MDWNRRCWFELLQFTRKSIIPVSAHLEHYNVHGLCVIDDELYVGVYSGGLNIYNLNTGAVKRYYISDERYNVQIQFMLFIKIQKAVFGYARKVDYIGSVLRKGHLRG